MSFDSLYGKLPIFLQDLAVTVKGWSVGRLRYGKEYKSALSGFLAREKSEAGTLRHQKVMLADALETASSTEFYGRIFQEQGKTWKDYLEPDLFESLPIIRKSDISRNSEAFRPRKSVASDSAIQTSGTTGATFSFPVSRNVEPEQWAVWWRYRSWHGIEHGDRCALFASAPVIRGALRGRPYRVNWTANEYRFSIFHINEGTAAAYVHALNEIRPDWIHGNPTAISLLSSIAAKQGLSLNHHPRCVTVGSENLLGWQKAAIREFFGCDAIQHYGLAEAVANISQCELGALHTDEDYSFVEYVDIDGSGVYSIVGTGFGNSAFALLRYDTGDLATLSGARCACGRPGRVVDSIDGRLTDYVVLPDGSRVASLAAPFHASSNLIGAQIYQGSDGSLTVRYIPGPGWSDEHKSRLEAALRLRVGAEIGISFSEVAELGKTPRGKMKLVVSDYG